MIRPLPGGLTVTLIGADGAGKSTIARALRARSSRPVTYIYMGANPEAATHMLFTTRLWLAGKKLMGGKEHVSGPPELDSLRKRPSRSVSRIQGHAKSLLHLGLHAPEEMYRQCLAWWAERRGRLVLQDRHPLLDYYASDVLGLRGWRRVGDRIHGFLIRRVYRGPGQVLLLDAPAEVLFARKPEGTLRSLRVRRDEYLALRGVIDDLHVIDVDRPIDAVLAQVEQLVGVPGAAGERDYVLPASSQVKYAAVPAVLDLLATLRKTGLPVWLDRGWGVDAIVGFVTRVHRDVDLVTVPGALDVLTEALAAAGDSDSSGLRVDIRETHDALEDGFGTIGYLGGIEVPCVDAERQLGWRVGRKLTKNDIQAIALLHGAAGTPVPNELRPFGKARVSYRARRLARSLVTLGEPDAATPRWLNKLRRR